MHTSDTISLPRLEISTTKLVRYNDIHIILTAKGVGVGLFERSRSSVDSNSNDAELRSFKLSFEAVFEGSREDVKLFKTQFMNGIKSID